MTYFHQQNSQNNVQQITENRMFRLAMLNITCIWSTNVEHKNWPNICPETLLHWLQAIHIVHSFMVFIKKVNVNALWSYCQFHWIVFISIHGKTCRASTCFSDILFSMKGINNSKNHSLSYYFHSGVWMTFKQMQEAIREYVLSFKLCSFTDFSAWTLKYPSVP